MNWGKQGAFLMLAVVVCWAAIPASACLLAARQTGQPDCCRGMLECGSPGMGANGSCCQTQPRNIAVSTVLAYSHEHAQRLTVVADHAGLPAIVSSRIPTNNALESPPPIFPPGGSSILRI